MDSFGIPSEDLATIEHDVSIPLMDRVLLEACDPSTHGSSISFNSKRYVSLPFSSGTHAAVGSDTKSLFSRAVCDEIDCCTYRPDSGRNKAALNVSAPALRGAEGSPRGHGIRNS